MLQFYGILGSPRATATMGTTSCGYNVTLPADVKDRPRRHSFLSPRHRHADLLHHGVEPIGGAVASWRDPAAASRLLSTAVQCCFWPHRRSLTVRSGSHCLDSGYDKILGYAGMAELAFGVTQLGRCTRGSDRVRRHHLRFLSEADRHAPRNETSVFTGTTSRPNADDRRNTVSSSKGHGGLVAGPLITGDSSAPPLRSAQRN